MSNYFITSHAKDRIRQRVGIDGDEAQQAWVKAKINRAESKLPQDNKTVYNVGSFEIICDGLRVVTVKPVDNVTQYASKLSGVVAKEIRKLLVPQERLLRKAEINVVELTLNFLKARNPKTKEIISGRLAEATDEKQRIADEVFAIKKAAKQYGVEI